jgi:uncharacterized protein (DUF1501 family)
MKRRDFLKRTVPAATLPLVMGGFSFKAYGRSPILEALVSAAAESDRILVAIQLNGGNDGLNTVIALDRYAELTAARSNILIPQSQVLRLTDTTGLHPSMVGARSLYDQGKLAIVQAVSYPNPNFSHFRATDIWLTAADSNQTLDSGWMGRYLDNEYPDYPNGYPNTVMPDPLAIQIGSIVSPALQGPSVSMGMAVTNPNSTYTIPGGTDTPPNTPAGHELTFIRQIAQQTQAYAVNIKSASSKGSNKSTFYPSAGSNSLADQLKIVARLISGGLKTRIYVVNLGGFDTHSGQLGPHSTLLGRLATAIWAFQDDLLQLGLDQRVIGMTFSEFGRRIKSNASGGTDHGSAAPMFLFGANINRGVYGTSPVLPATATVNDNVPMQHDFRWVYASILQDWFGASQTVLQDVLGNNTTTLPIIKPSAVLDVADGQPLPREFALYQNYPNPFNPSTAIRYALPRAAQVRLEVFTVTGQQVAALVNGYQSAGEHTVTFTADGLASGAYLYRMQAGDFVETKKFLLVR